jgi:hypothetical protein
VPILCVMLLWSVILVVHISYFFASFYSSHRIVISHLTIHPSYMSYLPQGGLPVIDASSSGVPYRGMKRFPEEESEHEGTYIFFIAMRT